MVLEGKLLTPILLGGHCVLAGKSFTAIELGHDFKVKLVVMQQLRDGEDKVSGRHLKRDFAEGDCISCQVVSDRDCQVALFCFQSDVSIVQFYPNEY